MSQKSPARDPSVPKPKQAAADPPREDEAETGAAERVQGAPEEERDPYDDLWDPDMDTRPVRIRKTRTRPRPNSRGRRREGV